MHYTRRQWESSYERQGGLVLILQQSLAQEWYSWIKRPACIIPIRDSEAKYDMKTRLKSVNYYHSSTTLLSVLQTSTDVAAVVVYYCRWWVRSCNEYEQQSNTCSCILVISRILMLHEYLSLRNLLDSIQKKIFTELLFQNKPLNSIFSVGTVAITIWCVCIDISHTFSSRIQRY